MVPNTENNPTPLLPFDPARIPESLKAMRRWAPWKAVWNERRGKYDKIPYRADQPQYGISTARPDAWFTFDAAKAAFDKQPAVFAGLGLVVTGLKDMVSVDLDNCISAGAIAPWAQDIVASLQSYTEVSPSGKGLRVFVQGTQEVDWTNHEIGVEVYGGNDARFLTVSGQRLDGYPQTVGPAPDGVLLGMQAQYAKEKTKATVIDLNMPDLLPEADLPDVADLEIGPSAKDFLLDGVTRNDRSAELHAAAVSLYSAGLDHQVVFSLLVHNHFAMGTALDHRRQDPERAMHYLWREQCLKGKPKARPRVASIDDFDDVSEPSASGEAPPVKPAPKKRRFEFKQAADYLNRAPVTWLIKRVLPKADVGAVFGESGAGKSFFVLDMVMAVASGADWMGIGTKQGTVAYICAEGAGGFTTRLRAYADYYLTDLGALPIHILGDAPNFLQTDDIRDLTISLKALQGVSVIVVDTLAQVTAGGNENSGEDMGKALAHCRRLATATGAMVLLVAHSGKNAERGLRGWSGIKGALDVEILVERSGEHRSATVTKMKDGSGEGVEYPFTLETVVLGQDEDGEDITSCVVKARSGGAGKATPKAPIKGVWQQTIKRVLVTLTDLSGPPNATELISAVVAEMPQDDGKKDRRREMALRYMQELVSKNHISIVDGIVNAL